jgi:succinate-acetate transporter protein
MTTRLSAAEGDHPDALGLWSFALASLFGNLPATGVVSDSSLFATSLIVVGGFAQLVAGRREHERGHVFGATSFTAFGFFWIVLQTNELLAREHLIAPSSPTATGCYLLMWGLFAVLLQAGAAKLSVALRVTVLLSWIGLLLRAIGALGALTWADHAGAWALVASAAAAAYTAAGQFLFATHGPLLPLSLNGVAER